MFFIKFSTDLELQGHDFAQLAQKIAEERHHHALGHGQGALQCFLIVGRQKSRREVLEYRQGLAYALPKGFELGGPLRTM